MRAPRRFSVPLHSLTTITLPVLVSLWSGVAAAHPGRWSPGSNWNSTAIHLHLLRGDSTHSQVIWWQSHYPPEDVFAGFHGGLWGWNPVETNCDSYPSQAFQTLTITNSPDSNVFCAGGTQLADGRLLVTGGTELHSPENGGRFNRIYNPALRRWDLAADMTERRWYPTATPLASGGRVLVVSGSQYGQMCVFGGRKQSGGLASDSLYRFGFAGSGQWDPPVVDADPSDPEPPPREGHTLTQQGSNALLFGGLDANGQFRQDLWALERHEDQQQTSDYQYQWIQLTNPSEVQSPVERAEHSALTLSDGTMVIFGGRRVFLGQEQVLSDVWRVARIGSQRLWQQVTITGSSPSARFGHAMATIIRTTPTTSDTMHLMVGGVGGTGQSPGDLALWRLRFTGYATAVWETVQVKSPSRPAPRWDHTLLYDPFFAGDLNCYDNRIPNLVLFGGRGTFGSAPGDTLSNELWRLWWPTADSLVWERDTLRANTPLPRAGHTAVIETATGDMLVMGGTTASGVGTDSVYVARLTARGCPSPTWRALAPHGQKLRGHRALLNFGGLVFSRIGEVYNPESNTWSALSNSPLLQRWYPFMHLAPNGKVFYSGPNKDTYWWDEAGSPAWTKCPSTTASDAVCAGAAVMYRPGKVMKAGTGLGDPGPNVAAHGKTRVIDLTAASPQWVNSTDMLARDNHNLVILPTGQVLVVGGTATVSNQVFDGVTRPEIWDPDANGGTGAWYGATGSDTLAPDTFLRDYHSTALLLPDARVLSAGGNANSNTRSFANIFCPPYLFAGDTLATRPAINEVVQRIRYGMDFAICKSGPKKTLKSVCLIRPGSPTHGFDQNQRYVPLTIRSYSVDSSRVTVSAPADSFVAPAGDYMLFLVDGRNVPCVARWMRVGSEWNTDTTAPDSVADLSSDAVSQNTIYWTWTVPGDDHASGQPWQHKLVNSSSPITSGSFASSNAVPNLAVPECVGSTQAYAKTGLAACTYYYAAIQVVDESNNYSAIGYSPGVRTLCIGGGGGGFAAHVAREEGDGSGGAGGLDAAISTALKPGATSTSLVPGGQGLLVADYERGRGTTSWTLHRVDLSALGEGATPDAARITFQEPDGAGGWRTRKELDDLPTDLGLRSLPRRGRVVLPASYEVTSVESHPPAFDLTSAQHSRLGELATDTLTTGASVTLAAGDTLRLAFSPTAEGGERGEDCFFIVSRPLQAGELNARRSPQEEQSQAQPLAFALHHNQPNPFAATTTIRFALPAAAKVRLEVYDLSGRRVRTLANGFYPPGEHHVEWDRRTAKGSLASPGLYFYRIDAGQYRDRKRMVVLP